MMTDSLSDFSDALAARVAAAAKSVVAITLPGLLPLSAILWRKSVAVTSEQVLAEGEAYTAVLPGGAKVAAKLAGRDPGTNVAAFTLEAEAPALERSSAIAVGELAILVGADGEGGPTARLGSVRRLGPAWTSMAGGKIDRLIVLDANLRPDTEGGPTIDARGRLVGLTTSGPRRRAMVIPHETVERVLDTLLKEGRVARGWLGISVQPVGLPENLRAAAGRESGLMLASLAKGGPAETAGMLPGDIILELDGKPVGDARGLSRMFGPDRVGKPVALRILRAGAVKDLSVTVGARPA
jgi:S1-C subfamily serine protease